MKSSHKEVPHKFFHIEELDEDIIMDDDIVFQRELYVKGYKFRQIRRAIQLKTKQKVIETWHLLPCVLTRNVSPYYFKVKWKSAQSCINSLINYWNIIETLDTDRRQWCGE